MTANQTIDGVPGLRSLLERVTSQSLGMSAKKDRAEAAHELRKMLDAPIVQRQPFGWFRTPKDCPLQGMFLHYDPEHGERDIQNALDFGFTVKRLYDTPAAQPQGEPVAWMDPICLERMGRQPERNFVVTGQCKSTYSVPLYAEQPAPVAVVLPERKEIDKYGEFYDSGWNDCLDDLERLNKAKY